MTKIIRFFFAVIVITSAYPAYSWAEKEADVSEVNPAVPEDKKIVTTYGYEGKNFRELFYTPLNPQLLSLDSDDIKSIQFFRATELVSVLFVDGPTWLFPSEYSLEDIRRSAASIPFMTEYVTRSRGFPKRDAVYKWKEKEVSIGYSWPILKGMSSTWKSAVAKDMEYYQRLKPIILKVIDEINRTGAIHLKFVEPDKEADNLAPIRIIGFNWGDTLRFGGNKIDNIAGGYIHMAQYNSWYFEGGLQGKVRFTNWAQNQVEGYLLPNSDNTLGRAACYIKAESSDEMLESYVSECLFRSLGFPGLGRMRGVLGPRAQPNGVTKISNNDIVLLKMLYDDVIDAGNDKNIVIEKLYKIYKEEVIH